MSENWLGRAQELLAESLEWSEIENATAVHEWEANAAFRECMVTGLTRRMRADGVTEGDIAALEQWAMARPNEYWGELREGRRPRDDM
jgi:hypothetical protein